MGQAFRALTSPTEVRALVVFLDIVGFLRLTRQMDNRELFGVMAEFADRVTEHVERADGLVVKFIGDAALLLFGEDEVEKGVAAVMDLKTDVEGWFTRQGRNNRLRVKMHFGSLVAGPLGKKGGMDIIGSTVNIAATLEDAELAMTPEVFRKLSPEMRKRFKKHTPPMFYIPVEARRPGS